MSYLKDKITLITGAASGIGADLAKRFAQEGSHVILADIDIDKAQHQAHLLLQKGLSATAYFVDVTSEQAVIKLYESIRNDFKRLDIMICNAGVQHIDSLENLSYNNWKKVVDVHLGGAFLLTKEALKMMYEKKGGKIIYIGSVHSKEASKLKGPYVAAKHGMLGLCKVVAKEGAEHGVAANIICPGFVKTPLTEKQIPEQAKALGISENEVIKQIMLKDTVDGEFTTLEDVSSAAVFLASFKTAALTGQSLIVSHGWCME